MSDAPGTPPTATSAEDAPPPKKKRRTWRWVLLVLVLVPLLLRGLVLRVFEIQSASMRPTFVEGDRLAVLRDTWESDPIERWDVVVLESSFDAEIAAAAEAVLKRVVGLPGETVAVREGDVWIGPTGADEQALSIARKPDALVAALLAEVMDTTFLGIPWAWMGPGELRRLDGEGIEILPDDAAPALARYGKVIDDGVDGAPGNEPVGDTALRLEIGPGEGDLRMTLREGADVFEARLATAARGGASLSHNGAGVVAELPAFQGLEDGDVVLMWNVDNGVRLFVDEELVLSYDYAENRRQTPGGELVNGPGLGVEGAPLVLRRVTILRDAHHTDDGGFATASAPDHLSPVGLGPHELFLLGDHGARSRDGRFFGPVERERVLGRPFALVWPWERSRWLDPNGLQR